MYIPPHFKETDLAEVKALIREFGFATLVSIKDNEPWATHLPLELITTKREGWMLRGHVARANPQWRNFTEGNILLAIFMGPHSYVSPSWYNHKNVPTWNYKAVHLYGKPTILEGEKLENMLQDLMKRYENLHSEKPLNYSELPAELLEKDLRGLVGFEIRIERIEAVSKLSQNRDSESYEGVIQSLRKTKAYDSEKIASEMEKRKK